MFRHLKDNKGDANVSKMTLIAIVFVVGAILLILITSAFRNPINRWFETVTKDWFADKNGEFKLMIDPFDMYERGSNGLYTDLEYSFIEEETGRRYVLQGVATMQETTNSSRYVSWKIYYPNGQVYESSGPNVITFSDDGKTVTIGTTYTTQRVFEAQLPNK